MTHKAKRSQNPVQPHKLEYLKLASQKIANCSCDSPWIFTENKFNVTGPGPTSTQRTIQDFVAASLPPEYKDSEDVFRELSQVIYWEDVNHSMTAMAVTNLTALYIYISLFLIVLYCCIFQSCTTSDFLWTQHKNPKNIQVCNNHKLVYSHLQTTFNNTLPSTNITVIITNILFILYVTLTVCIVKMRY